MAYMRGASSPAERRMRPTAKMDAGGRGSPHPPTMPCMEQKDVLKALQRDHAAELKLAAERLSGTAKHTEIIPSPVLSEMTGHTILLKPENLQVTGSFKIRGAYNKIASLSEEELARGIVTASAGNHARCGLRRPRTRREGHDPDAHDHPAVEGRRHQGLRCRRGAARRRVRRGRRLRRRAEREAGHGVRAAVR